MVLCIAFESFAVKLGVDQTFRQAVHIKIFVLGGPVHNISVVAKTKQNITTKNSLNLPY